MRVDERVRGWKRDREKNTGWTRERERIQGGEEREDHRVEEREERRVEERQIGAQAGIQTDRTERR